MQIKATSLKKEVRNIKILIVSNYRGDHTARPEAEIFVALAELGMSITIMTYEDAGYIPRFESAGIHVIGMHPTSKNDRAFQKALTREMEREKYDILHAFNNKAISNCIKIAKGFPVKLMIYRGAAANMAWWNPLNYLKFYHPRIDRVVANSDEIRDNFRSIPFAQVDKAVTILKGHDVGWYRDTPVYDMRKELALEDDVLLFVTVANNRSVKGIQVLLDAIEMLPHDHALSFLIVGGKMEKFRNKRRRNVHFLGGRQDALSIVAACDVYICPSTGSEALTKSVIEAMSLGVVPLISDIAGNKPLVDDMINGFVFQNRDTSDLKNRILMMVDNRHVLADFSKAARWKIERDLNIDRTVEGYQRLYLETVS